MVALVGSLPARLEDDASIGAGVPSLWRGLESAAPAGLRRCQAAGAYFTVASPRVGGARGLGAAAAVQNRARQLLGGRILAVITFDRLDPSGAHGQVRIRA